MERPIRALLICGTILASVDALIMFILTFVFFSAANQVATGGANNYGGMTANEITSVGVVFLILTFVNVGAAVFCSLTIMKPSMKFYIITLALCVLAGLVAPGIVGSAIGLIESLKPKEEQPNAAQ